MRLNKIRLVIERVLSFFASIHSINFEHCQFICVGEYLSISGWNLIDHCEQINLWALFAAIDQNRFYSVQPIDFDDDNFHDEQWTNVTLLRLSHFVITFIVSIFFFIIFSQSFVSLQLFFYLSLFQLKKTKSKGAKTLAAEMKYAQLDAFPSWKLQKHQSLMKTFWTFSRAAHWHRMARFVEKRKQKLKTDFIAVSLSMCVCVHLYVDSLFGHSDRAIRRWHVTNVRYFIAWVVQQINNVHKNVRKTKCHSQQIIVKKFFTRVLRTVRRVKALGKCKDWAKVIGSKATTQEKKNRPKWMRIVQNVNERVRLNERRWKVRNNEALKAFELYSFASKRFFCVVRNEKLSTVTWFKPFIVRQRNNWTDARTP